MKKHLIAGMVLGLGLVYIALAQNGHLRQTVETSPLARQMLTNDSAASWLSILGVNTNGALAGSILQVWGTGTNTSLYGLTAAGTNTLGTTLVSSLTGNIAGATNFQSTNLSGADNFAFFGVGMIPRRYEPANNNHVPNWGGSQVFSADGINWKGAASFPAVFNTNQCNRDIAIYKAGNVIALASTAAVGGDVGTPYVNIWTSTNAGSTWNYVMNAYFTNAALAYENPSNTWGPTWFVYNGKPSLIAGCFFVSGATRTFRIIQCLDTNGFASWSTATNVNMTGISAANANGPFLYDDTANSGNWYLWHEDSSANLYLLKGSNPLGPWTSVNTFTFNGDINEGACMLHLPNGKYRLYVDNYFKGKESYTESTQIESGWGTLLPCGQQYYFGNFKPIILTNLQDISAAAQAASSTSDIMNWNQFVDNPTWATSADYAHLDFAVRANINSISSGNSILAFGYRYGEGFEANVSNHPSSFIIGENGITSVNQFTSTNGFSSLNTTNISANAALITVAATGLTNTLNTEIWGWVSVTNSSGLSNYDCARNLWSTNLGPVTNFFFILQSNGVLRAAANAIDVTKTTWHAH